MFWRFAAGRGDIELGTQRREPLQEDFGRQTVTFALIGAVSTVVSLGVFLLLRDPIGPVAANVVGFTATAAGNSWANRRWTFRSRYDRGRWRRRLATIMIFALSLIATSIVVANVQGDVGRELLALSISWTVAATVRFTLLRGLMRRQQTAPSANRP